jgi:type IV pilus assembly protein PilA
MPATNKEMSMLKTLSARIGRGEEEQGFTLIELMVVVLIIAILLAIAIPTFLGAKGKSQDRAAQSNLRNALTAEKTFYTDNQFYTASATPLAVIEPALQFTTGTPTAAGSVGVAVTSVNGTGTNDNVVLQAKSAGGNCFTIMDEAISGSTDATGTFYLDACPASLPTLGTTAPTGKASATAWGNGF